MFGTFLRFCYTPNHFNFVHWFNVSWSRFHLSPCHSQSCFHFGNVVFNIVSQSSTMISALDMVSPSRNGSLSYWYNFANSFNSALKSSIIFSRASPCMTRSSQSLTSTRRANSVLLASAVSGLNGIPSVLRMTCREKRASTCALNTRCISMLSGGKRREPLSGYVWSR